jgi:hypothetical protein
MTQTGRVLAQAVCFVPAGIAIVLFLLWGIAEGRQRQYDLAHAHHAVVCWDDSALIRGPMCTE